MKQYGEGNEGALKVSQCKCWTGQAQDGFESEAQEKLSDGDFQDWNINAMVGKMEEVSVGWLFHEIALIR